MRAQDQSDHARYPDQERQPQGETQLPGDRTGIRCHDGEQNCRQVRRHDEQERSQHDGDIESGVRGR